MNSGKQNKVEEVLESIQNIERAKAPDYLLSKINGKIQNKRSSGLVLNPGRIWWAAAAILLLSALNFTAILNKVNSQKQSEYQSLIRSYGLERENYGL